MMRILLLKFKMLWLTPGAPIFTKSKARKLAVLRGIGTFGLLGVLMFFLAQDALAIYCIWLLVLCGHGVYQYRYAFVSSLDRPPQYEETTGFLLFLDILNHVALAGFSSAGWWALAPLALAWLSFGRMIGDLALIEELNRIYREVRENFPAEPVEQQRRRTLLYLQDRVELQTI